VDKLAELIKSKKVVPAAVEFIDIAGLVKGAHQGEGLGNQFLANIREVDAIVQVVRDFSDPTVVQTGEGVVEKDVETVRTELILADLQTLEKQTQPKGSTNKQEIRQWELVEKLKKSLDQGKLASEVITDTKEKEEVAQLQLLTFKPILIVVNTDETKIATATKLPSNDMDEIYLSAKMEAELIELDEKEREAYLKEVGVKEAGLNKLINKSYQVLDLISFLTTGPLESRAWTVKKGTKAPQAAGVIHTDFEKGFIRVEAIPYEKFIEVGTWEKAKEKGWVHLGGKDYEIQDGDVVYFRVNA
jgi:GTP-binding protein YchF